ncbi:hypothetical protein CC117_14320 [Parafrankia colletiae]|uniref:Monooxygenase n=1 Tax=Parafrankia colletiae TaxID=573497 RepID=A0A1S1R047_9ACTN|nr:DUF5990 family protein [Parafrankia colletiae]MCK9903772.1 DUF5990 family protein [Frankia sp. Cpl3]OHV40323.1 hypothetical protein CC117_14320 [Parafrankia colletiae]
MTGSDTIPTGRRAAAGDPAGIRIRIEATDLPGRDLPRHRGIQVGVQRRNSQQDLLDLHPGDAPTAVWTLPATATPTQAGLDITGPHIQGRPGGRFIYLSWGTVDGAGTFARFSRAKLMFDAVDPATLDAARRTGGLLARLKLSDARGNPLCAAVRPPLIDWSAGQVG